MFGPGKVKISAVRLYRDTDKIKLKIDSCDFSNSKPFTKKIYQDFFSLFNFQQYWDSVGTRYVMLVSK